ncbi:hypothetical protein BH11BAC7_BH11BAC7_08990 [soil metagenome]
MKIIYALICSFFLFTGCAKQIKVNSSDVPSVVINAFNAKYPDAQGVEWMAEDKDGFYFAADFKTGVVEKAAQFKSDGTFVEEVQKK